MMRAQSSFANLVMSTIRIALMHLYIYFPLCVGLFVLGRGVGGGSEWGGRCLTGLVEWLVD